MAASLLTRAPGSRRTSTIGGSYQVAQWRPWLRTLNCVWQWSLRIVANCVLKCPINPGPSIVMDGTMNSHRIMLWIPAEGQSKWWKDNFKMNFKDTQYKLRVWEVDGTTFVLFEVLVLVVLAVALWVCFNSSINGCCTFSLLLVMRHSLSFSHDDNCDVVDFEDE
jgi:hypothetical protein